MFLLRFALVAGLAFAPATLMAAGPKKSKSTALTMAAKKKRAKLRQKRLKAKRNAGTFKVAKKDRRLSKRLWRKGLQQNLGRSFD